MASTPANVADGGALTTDGTFIYAFQGKTTTFWRYDIAANTWSDARSVHGRHRTRAARWSSLPASIRRGGSRSLSASRSLVVTGDTVNVTFPLESSTAVNNVVPGALSVTPTGGASCSSLTGPTLTSADDDIADIDDPVAYKWTCTSPPARPPAA